MWDLEDDAEQLQYVGSKPKSTQEVHVGVGKGPVVLVCASVSTILVDHPSRPEVGGRPGVLDFPWDRVLDLKLLLPALRLATRALDRVKGMQHHGAHVTLFRSFHPTRSGNPTRVATRTTRVGEREGSRTSDG